MAELEVDQIRDESESSSEYVRCVNLCLLFRFGEAEVPELHGRLIADVDIAMFFQLA